MRWLDGITDSIDINLGDCRRQRSLACHSPWGHKESLFSGFVQVQADPGFIGEQSWRAHRGIHEAL